MLIWIAVLVLSLGVLVKASDWFTASAETIGRAFGLPTFVIGVTIIAFGTSLPELVSSVIAVIDGASEIVVGNVAGSNIANLLLVLGLTGVVAGHLRVYYEVLSVDLPFLAGSAMFLAMVAWDGTVGRFEALLCLSGLAIYLGYALTSRPVRTAEEEENDKSAAGLSVRTALVLIASGGLIYLGASFTVRAVIELAALAGIGTEVIAASAVALGTSLPEVTVTIAAVRRGQAELAVGNILGSNIFNVFAVVGISGLVGPLHVPASLLEFALPLMIVATLLTFFSIMERELTKWEGWLLLLFYVYFIGALFGLI
jgi:cation:H+ antiporter